MLYILGFGCDLKKYSVSRYFTVHLNFLHVFIIIHSFCTFVEHKAFMKLFHLVHPKLVILLLSSFLLPSAVPILLFFSRFSLSTPLPFTLRNSTACHFITPCGLRYIWPIQHHFLSFIFCSVGICFVLCHNSSFEILTGYMKSKYVIGISLQTMGVNYLSV